MSNQSQPLKLYVKLFLGSVAFGALLYFMQLHVIRSNVTVPYWMFLILLAIMGSLLGVDILDQYRGDSK